MEATKVKKKKRPLGVKQKIALGILCAAACIFVVYVAWYLIRFRLYRGYEKYLKDYEYEQASELKLGNEATPSVPGYKLVCENDSLKLYTDTKTSYIAVYDKRTGEITYSNPPEADNDEKAGAAQKNFLKSTLLIYYYSSTVSSAYMDNFSKCISLGQFEYEGIKNGIRYLYKVGNLEPVVNKDTGETSEGTYFEIALEFRLDGDSVVASVPAKGIKEHGNGFIYRIHMLRTMGAAGPEDEGYMVVPNGSGSLIRFNNGKTGAAMYSQYIYEIDPMVATYTTLEYTKGARLPIYGFYYNDKKTILAEVEDGATVSVLNAQVAGSLNSYNTCFPIFCIRNTDNLVMFGNAKDDTYIMEENFYDVNYTVRYHFLSKDYEGYVGMAKYYREKLEKEGVLARNTKKGDLPFYYDIISGVKETGHILGVQYLHAFSMTTFDEAGEIAKDLAAGGITNQVMNLQGWFNGGYYHDAPHDMRILGKLGGRAGLEKLNDTLESVNGKLYADVAFQKVSFADKHFPYNFESSRYYGGGYVAAFGLLDPSSLRNTSSLGYSETRYNLLSPKFLNRYVDSFTKKFSKLGVDGISLRDLGNTLSSDKMRTNVTDREQALDIVLGQFETIAAMGKNVMVDGANAYAFKYSDDIINVPYKDNDYFICDETIPLYQMILHGYVDYSSELLNDENVYNSNELYLYLIETGTAPHFNFTWDNSSDMKETGLNRFYSTTYSTMKNEAIEIYNKLNEVLKNVSGEVIVNHEINGDCRMVEYSNGVKIYVNYGLFDGEINGVKLASKSYKWEGK